MFLYNQEEETDLVRTCYPLVGKWKIFQKTVEKSKFQTMELKNQKYHRLETTWEGKHHGHLEFIPYLLVHSRKTFNDYVTLLINKS